MVQRSRATFDEIREDERRRLRSLESLGTEFGRTPGWVRDRWEDGSDADVLRAKLTDEAHNEQRRADSFRTSAHPVGVLSQAGRVRALLCAMGRYDLAGALARQDNVELESYRDPVDALQGACGVTGAGADPWKLVRATFTAGASGAGALDVATRTASQLVAMHAWAHTGRLWRAVCRVVKLADQRPTRIQVSATGAVDLDPVPDMGASPLSGAVDTVWPFAVIPEWDASREARALSRKRVINAGLSEIDSIVSSAATSWNVALDNAAAALLASSKVASTTGNTTRAHVISGIAELESQMVSGLPLSSGRRPWLVCGRAKRDLMRQCVPTAAGDESAICEKGWVIPSIGQNVVLVVSPEFPPLVVGSLAVGADGSIPAPEVYVGADAGPVGDDGRSSEWGVATRQDVSPIAAIEQGSKILGVVKLV